MIKTCYNSGQKEMLCLIIDKCRRQKLCKRAQKISAAAPLRVMASVKTLASKRSFRVLLLELVHLGSCNWNIVESDVKHHETNKQTFVVAFFVFALLCFVLFFCIQNKIYSFIRTYVYLHCPFFMIQSWTKCLYLSFSCVKS